MCWPTTTTTTPYAATTPPTSPTAPATGNGWPAPQRSWPPPPTLLPAGTRRDAILHRSFASELSKLTRPDFLTLDPATQTDIATGIATLADQYLTDPSPPASTSTAACDYAWPNTTTTNHLLTLIGHNSTHQPPPLHLDHHPHGDRLYATYPGFRQSPNFPDPWYLSPTHPPTPSPTTSP